MRVGGAPPPPVMLPGSAMADDVEDAEDPESSEARLLALAGHHSTEVRMRVAGNLSAPPAALTRLAHDGDVFVAVNAASNTSAPPEVLEEIVRRDCAPSVRQQLVAAVAENPAASSGLLAGLASDDDPVVRHASEEPVDTGRVVGGARRRPGRMGPGRCGAEPVNAGCGQGRQGPSRRLTGRLDVGTIAVLCRVHPPGGALHQAHEGPVGLVRAMRGSRRAVGRGDADRRDGAGRRPVRHGGRHVDRFDDCSAG